MTADLPEGVPQPRLPVLDRADLAAADRALYDGISRTRGGMPSSFRVFLNHPATARAIADFGHHLRFDTGLPDRHTEVVVMRTAALTADDYIWAHHAKLAADAGLTPDELRLLRTAAPGAVGGPDAAVAAVVDATITTRIDEAAFAAARAALGDRAVLDLAVLSSYFVMLHHLFAALGVGGDVDTRIHDDGSRQREGTA